MSQRWNSNGSRIVCPVPLRLLFVLVALLVGCATPQTNHRIQEGDVAARAQSKTYKGLTVSTSVLSAEESAEIYGVPLAEKSIQPVWIQVDNNEAQAFWLLPQGMDAGFFPASEAAEAFAAGPTGNDLADLQAQFEELAFRNPVPPGGRVSGHVLTNLDEGVKLVQVDLISSKQSRSFSFLSAVPGFQADYHVREAFSGGMYPESELVDYDDLRSLRPALEALPCCTTNADGSREGDPLNLVIIGGLSDAFPALVRRGWRPTEATRTESVMKMIKSGLSGERYRYAPVSPLYVYGRPQELALQKARDNIHQRNHLRLWLAPLRYQGKEVWVGQISRDIGSRFTIHSPYLTTHKIDPNVDEARDALIEDMVYSQNLAEVGLVAGVGAAPKDMPRQNLTTDPYYTNGFRAVLIFDAKPTSMTDIGFLQWESPGGGILVDQDRRAVQ